MGDVSDDVSIESFSFDELATSLPENRRPLDDDSADEGIECSEETFFDDDLRDRGAVPRMTTRGAAARPSAAAAAAAAAPEPRFRGVSANKDRWQARIKCGGYQEYIGTFDEKSDAARAYDARVRALGLDARLNFPDEDGPAPQRIPPRAPRREALARARRKADAKADAADATALLTIRAAAAPW